MPDSLLLRIGRLRRHVRAIAWRGLILVVVFSCGLAALFLDVEFSERPGMRDASLLTRLYYILGLFVLGGLDLGIPTGGSALGRVLLWLAYFAAPAITTASVVEGILRAIAPTRWQLRRLRGHIIVAGSGRLGRLYLKRLRQSRPHTPVIMVDIKPEHPKKTEIRDVHRAELLVGDIREPAILDALRLDRADRVFLFTGDDFVNLDAATNILAREPSLAARTVVHVANLHFLRLIADTRVARQCTIINKYHIAAAQLVRTVLLDYFHQTKPRDIVVLAGFGRFGQTVLDELQRSACDKFARVVIIDLKAGEVVSLFAQQVGFESFYKLETIEGDLNDPRVWQTLEGMRHVAPVFIIGSGDEGANLSTALWVKSAFPSAHIIVRNFYTSSFAEEVSRDSGISIFAIADLVASSMPDDWFGETWLDRKRPKRLSEPELMAMTKPRP